MPIFVFLIQFAFKNRVDNCAIAHKDAQFWFEVRLPVKGVLHPWPVFWLFMHFSQKLQHIGNK